MSDPVPSDGPDTGFTLVAEDLSRRREAARRHAMTVQIPALRALGFCVLCTIAGLYGADPSRLFPASVPWGLVALNVAYATLAWAALWSVRDAPLRDPLALLLLHLDIAVWLVNVNHLEVRQGALYFAYFMLARVVDQVGFGFRRAAYFLHVVVCAYLAYAILVETFDPARADLVDRLGAAATLYLVGFYFAAVGLVTERLRRRARAARSAALALVGVLERKNESLRRQALDLEAARAAAEQANVAKSQFLAVTSHEIRTPMNGILGAMELLVATPLTTEQLRYVHVAHRSGTTLLALIDDVLDLSRIESGRLGLEPRACELAPVIGEAIELARMLARDKALRVEVDLSPGLPAWIRTDPLRLRQVLVNLLGNAVKFTDQGQVTLRAARAPDDPRWWRLAVEDTGLGIPAEQLGAIFDAFTQADSSSTRRHGGWGLGLAIVHEIVTRMGGTITVDSAPGQGSRFVVRLPLEEAQDPRPVEPAAPPADAAAALRVLLAEDDPINQMVVAGVLERLGCTVDMVEDGAAACDAAARGDYDIAFFDCHMPRVDGWEAARRIRATEAEQGRRRLVIVALTADALPSDRERCLAAGMDDFLTKPISSARLAEALSTWTGRATNHLSTQW